MERDHEYKLKRSPIPALSAIVTAAVYALIIAASGLIVQSANLWLHILAALIISGTVSKLVGCFFPVQRIRTVRKYIAPVSGDVDVDKQLREADRILKDADRFALQLRPVNGTLSASVTKLVTTGRKILEYVAVDSRKSKSLHRFFGYYLPTLDKLLRNYILLENHAADTKNANTTKQEIEDAVCAMTGVFTKQLDKLFDDTALDISTDIDVLENVMTTDSGEELTKNQKKQDKE